MRKLTQDQKATVLTRIADGDTRASIARDLGVSAAHIGRLAKGKLRTADEFTTGAAAIRAVQRQQDPGVWDIERIRNARDAQMRGEFAEPVMLARAMRTVGELFVAYHNRIAPQAAIAAELQACGGARGKAVARKAAEYVICPRSVLQSITGTLANHGIAIGIVRRETNDDGTMITMRLEEWPLEHVRWNASLERLETTARDASAPEVITHGDGTWIVFRKFATDPWAQEAAVMPGALLWGALAYGVRDWAAASAAHGQSKIVGELPEGFALRDADGVLTPIGREFITLLQDLVSGEAGAGIKPTGSKVDFIANGSQAWQVFERLVLNREKIAARIYLGTDAILGSVGGSPGVDIAALFGVATTKIQGDFEALEQGLNTGLYQVWTAVNFGDSRYSPKLVFQMPDPDAARKIEDYAKRQVAFFAALDEYKKHGFIADQEVISALAKRYDIEVPVLAEVANRSVPLDVAPTDLARVFTADEIRASRGAGPMPGGRGAKTIPELEAEAAAANVPPAALTMLSRVLKLAGNFDESKHPRARDGKFGQGGGSSEGGSDSDAPKDDDTEDSPEAAREEASGLLSDFAVKDDELTKRAAAEATEKKPKWRAAERAARKAEAASDADHPGGATEESVDNMNPEAKERWDAASKARDEADQLEAEYTSAAKYVKDAPKRKKALARYEKAVKSGNVAAAHQAGETLNELTSDDTYASGSDVSGHELHNFDAARIDGDGDGRTGAAEEADDEESDSSA